MLARLLGFSSQAPDDVWFSRDIHNNQLQHWMLVVKGHKFELVRSAQGDFIFICDYERGWNPDRERQKPGSRMRGGYGNGYDNWCMVRIGGSCLSDREIERCFAGARAGYPPRLSWTQCQDFLRGFVDQLIDHRDPNYWRFFVDSTAAERWGVPQLPPPPAILVQLEQARARERAQEQRNVTRRVENLNSWQAGFFRAQQQNIAMNNQLMQNNQNFGMGYGN